MEKGRDVKMDENLKRDNFTALLVRHLLLLSFMEEKQRLLLMTLEVICLCVFLYKIKRKQEKK